MTVWHLIGYMRTEGHSAETAADNYELPLEAVHEAMQYYAEHRDIVQADNAEEKRRLRARGYALE